MQHKPQHTPRPRPAPGTPTPHDARGDHRVEILINAGLGETRAARLESGTLQEVHIQRDTATSSVGNLYLGCVQRVLPGMQAAFVEIGTERAAFLQLSDMAADNDSARRSLRIEQRLQAGDRLIVQVARDAMGHKGARLTTQQTMPSRFLIYMPHTTRIGISARIEHTEERNRLSQTVNRLRQELNLPGGFVVRTAADGVTFPALAADMRFLATLWQDLQSRARRVPPRTLLYKNPSLPIRMLRDLLTPEVANVIVDNAQVWQEMIEFTHRFAPEFSDRVNLHDQPARPLFTRYGVEDAIERALQPTVPLKSGGFLVIEQTEAMITVDVNTGGFVGSSTLEQTVLRTNLEAAQTVARQLRLRNLGGIIVIDFIDMVRNEHKQRVLDTLRQALAADSAKTTVGSISELGLVELTRKRSRDSLQHLLCQPCDACGGRGHVKAPTTMVFELFREMQRQAARHNAPEIRLLILAGPDLLDELLGNQADHYRRLCEQAGIDAQLQSETLYGPEQFDVVII